MYYLSLNDAIRIHDEMVSSYGGTLGIRDEKLLESAVFRCQASFGGEDLYRDIFEKAAAIFHGIIFDHPFIDGNKRAAVACAIEFLERNAQVFIASNDEVVAFPLWVERNRPEIEEIARWFKRRCRRLTKRRKSEEDSKSD
ncbi:hypothetical protein A2721_01745 [Candidatus Gottesmanbacteria bacterium RIFCSPHIGHO2_01_FULL_47_48]|uniref:Fido domain-containing protein n=1 Tax=Candidatus Gottesmanbacteria bacterium RIFCSPHIGHO2_01_FULL_47_48 TaxID=1798381 RepID=A0A1F6A1D8_9BACT|nr:MAG: hypothetical protein A2721_01745 [Candidatus Gottesmanbacteria bacterium RIFCSPHIGHO2_01_FULL_47_48]